MVSVSIEGLVFLCTLNLCVCFMLTIVQKLGNLAYKAAKLIQRLSLSLDWVKMAQLGTNTRENGTYEYFF